MELGLIALEKLDNERQESFDWPESCWPESCWPVNGETDRNAGVGSLPALSSGDQDVAGMLSFMGGEGQ